MKSKRNPSASRSTGNLIIDTSALITWVKKGQAENSSNIPELKSQ